MEYRNKKNGKVYEKLAEVTDCTNGNEDVLYALYRLKGEERLFIRKLSEFEVKFEKIGE